MIHSYRLEILYDNWFQSNKNGFQLNWKQTIHQMNNLSNQYHSYVRNLKGLISDLKELEFSQYLSIYNPTV